MELLCSRYSVERAEGKVLFAKAVNLTLPISTSCSKSATLAPGTIQVQCNVCTHTD